VLLDLTASRLLQPSEPFLLAKEALYTRQYQNARAYFTLFLEQSEEDHPDAYAARYALVLDALFHRY
jgi:hypothetical protein